MERKSNAKKEIVVVVSGGFDPIHYGHLRMFKHAKELGDKLIVILNSDEWLKRKKGTYFMSAKERAEIIESFDCVDGVHIHKSVKPHVVDALAKLKPDIFANGGDRRNEEDIPEAEICKELGIEMRFNVGGGKISSSSDLLKNYCDTIMNKRN